MKKLKFSRFALALLILGRFSFAADPWGPFLDCAKALEGHFEVTPLSTRLENLKKKEGDPDLLILLAPGKTDPSVYLFAKEQAWSFPLPLTKLESATATLKMANLKWTGPKETSLATLVLEQDDKGKLVRIQLMRSDDESGAKPLVFKAGEKPVVAVMPSNSRAVDALAGELLARIGTVGRSYRTQKDVFGLDAGKDGKSVPSLETEYLAALDTCYELVKKVSEGRLPPGFGAVLLRERKLIDSSKKDGDRHRQAPDEHSNGESPSDDDSIH